MVPLSPLLANLVCVCVQVCVLGGGGGGGGGEHKGEEELDTEPDEHLKR